MLISPIIFSVPVVIAASPSVENAERMRLADEMRSLARREQWPGVDRKYRDMLRLKKATPSFNDHNLGAQAAYNLGNIAGTHRRLNRALAVKKDEKASEWLAEISAGFFAVEINIHKRYEGQRGLIANPMPIVPEKASAVIWAQRRLKAKGSFKGMLPAGEYTIDSQRFKVEKGQEAKIITLGPPKGGPIFAYVGPRFDLGASFAQASAASNGSLNSAPFGGGGTRLGLGLALGLSNNFSLLLEAGYHNILSSGDAPNDDLRVAFGYEATPTVSISAPLSTGIGTYHLNERVVGSESGAEAYVNSWNATTRSLEVSINTGDFRSGEYITGTASSARYQVFSYNNDLSAAAVGDEYFMNDEFETEADQLLDFTESNPFGDV